MDIILKLHPLGTEPAVAALLDRGPALCAEKDKVPFYMSQHNFLQWEEQELLIYLELKCCQNAGVIHDGFSCDWDLAQTPAF